MSRKRASFGQVLAYFHAPSASQFLLAQNLLSPTSDLEALEAEFQANAQLLPRRKNGNVLFHEILSFHATDRGAITPAVLTTLTRRYLELRAPYALAYAVAHFDRVHPHVHLLLSANNVGSTRRLRLSQRQFRRVQQQLEQFQRQHFPQLSSSLAQQPRGAERIQQGRREQEQQRRSGRRSRKAELRLALQGVFTTATSGADCHRRLRSQGLQLYRRGSTVGVEVLTSQRRYRLRTLGLADAFSTARGQWRETAEFVPAAPRRRGHDRGLDLDLSR